MSGELKANQPNSESIVNSLNEIMNEMTGEYDYIIIDTAAGTHCPVIAALDMCDIVFAVAEPTPLGSHDLELILGLLKKLEVKSGIVLNRHDIGDERLISSLAKKFNTDIIARIPYSEKIVKQYSSGKPIVDDNIKRVAGGLR